MKRLLIVGAQHGDERLGHRLYRYLVRTNMTTNVDFVCGNPRAYRQNVRYTETDLNRSYGVDRPQSYEEKRAAKILRRIANGNYDYVLDIHTSRSDCDMFLITANLGPVVRQMIGATSMNRVAIMPPAIAQGSLIGNAPQALSIEVARTIEAQSQTLECLAKVIGNLVHEDAQTPQSRQLFYVEGTIANDTPIDASAKNFEKCHLGIYPVIYRHKGGTDSAHKGFYASNVIMEVI